MNLLNWHYRKSSLKNYFNQQKEYADEFKILSKSNFLKLFKLLRIPQLELLKYAKKDDKILDCGCGDGYSLNCLKKRGFHNLYGIDIDEKLLNEIKEPSYKIKKMSATELDKNFEPDFFDIILCYDLFHHLINLEEYQRAIQALKTVLKKNGYLFIADPDNNLFFKLMRWFAKVFSAFSKTLKAINEIDTVVEKNALDFYFANKKILYKLLMGNFKTIKTKNAFYRSITIFQKID